MITFKRYFFKALLFALPLIIYGLIILIVDPYNFINLFKVIDNRDKFKVVQRTDESSPRGNILWKAVHYKRNPVPNIIIGDSQGKDINVDIIEEQTGEKYFNFCSPGASFSTMFNTFWFATEQTKLEKVCFQLAFMNYNAARDYDLWHFAEDYFKRPYEYFTTKEIFFDAIANIAWVTTRNEKIIQRGYEYLPPDAMEKLAQQRLNLFFSEYVYPQTIKDELEHITDYCRKNNIEYCFLILPVYKGVDEHLAKNNLFDDKLTFKQDVYSLGPTYDLDKLAGLKADRFNFIDYFHPTPMVMDSLTRLIWNSLNPYPLEGTEMN